MALGSRSNLQSACSSNCGYRRASCTSNQNTLNQLPSLPIQCCTVVHGEENIPPDACTRRLSSSISANSAAAKQNSCCLLRSCKRILAAAATSSED